MGFQKNKAKILERHLQFIRIQLPHITYCTNETPLVTVTHCNDFSDLTFERFHFLTGAFA